MPPLPDGMPLLRAEKITKRFPGVAALQDVHFDLYAGEIHALCGENGAGKSTLIKLLSGIHPHGSYEGELCVCGTQASFHSIADAERAGIAVICQELALVPEMSVAENIFLGAEPVRGLAIDWARIHHESRQLLERFDLRVDPASRTDQLGMGQRQLLEILKALRKNSKILILDEPTAALTERETEILLATLKNLRRSGIGCIYISHKLKEVFAIADRITVLRDGLSVATLETLRTDPQAVIRLMVGREIRDFFPRRATRPGPIRLRVQNLDAADPRTGETFLRGISFEVRSGEVLGIGGLMGSGRTELMMHLFGAWGRRVRGTVQLDDDPIPPYSPERALRRGLALVTEDRRRYGLIPGHDIGFNLSLSSLSQFSPGGVLAPALEILKNMEFLRSLRIKAPSLESAADGLSGGNQQKVVIGRALMTRPKVILLDEPTRGVDVGAKLEIYEIINRMTAAGEAVILVSSELPELLGMSDRILMLHEGASGGIFPRDGASQEALMSAAMGHRTTHPISP